MDMDIRENVDLTAYNSFAVAANATFFAVIRDIAQVEQALRFADDKSLAVLLLGGGSNILLCGHFQGLVCQIGLSGIEVLPEPGRLKIAAGENWHSIVEYCLNNELYGIENLALIPGSVGAAPIQNIGAYGAEIADVFVELEAFDRHSQQFTTLDKAACEFAYRDSLFKRAGKGRYVITSVTLQLSRKWQPNIAYPSLSKALTNTKVSARQVFEQVCHIRRERLPDPSVIGNAGSFFKNPVVSIARFQSLRELHSSIPCYQLNDPDLVKIPAAWLLEAAGWKGRELGPAAVHGSHSLVLVNTTGKASGNDILRLAEEMSASVQSSFGIELEPEVQIIQTAEGQAL